jgi:hypothetical protein
MGTEDSRRAGTVRPLDWTAELVALVEWHWDHLLRPRLDGLTDEEFLWEPAPGCWSVRRRREATTSRATGAGDVVVDLEWPPPDPAPLTTIAWRMAHLTHALAERDSRHFGDGSVTDATMAWSLSARDGLALLDHWYHSWVEHLRPLDAAALAAPCGPREGPFARAPFAALVLHIARELIHHGAEVALLRDLHRVRGGPPS